MIILKRIGAYSLYFICLLLLLVLPNNKISGQRRIKSPAPPPAERVYLGGNIGLQFGTYTYLEFSPVVGYWLAPRLSMAVGPSFKYYKDPYGSTDVWGGKAYTRFAVINDLSNIIPSAWGISIYLHGEYEMLSFRPDYLNVQTMEPRIVVNTILAGAGLSQPMGNRGNVSFTLLWVVDNGGYQIYTNPEYRIELTFRLFTPRPSRSEEERFNY